MTTPVPEVIDQKILDAITALGQLTTERIILIGIIIGLLVMGFYLRLRFKGEETEARRIEENSKIMLQFAAMVDRADTNREKALDNRNSDTAKAISQQAVAYTTALAETRVAIEKITAVMESGNVFRAEQIKASHELKEEFRGLRGDINTHETRMIGNVEGLNTNILGLINEIGALKEMMTRLLRTTEYNPAEHAAIMRALETQTTQLNALIELLSPTTPPPIVDISPGPKLVDSESA